MSGHTILSTVSTVCTELTCAPANLQIQLAEARKRGDSAEAGKLAAEEQLQQAKQSSAHVLRQSNER